MDIIQIYSIVLGGIFALSLMTNLALSTTLRKRFSLWLSKHIIYPPFFRRHRFIGPWSRGHAIVQFIYITTNILCLGLRLPTLPQAGRRGAICRSSI